MNNKVLYIILHLLSKQQFGAEIPPLVSDMFVLFYIGYFLNSKKCCCYLVYIKCMFWWNILIWRSPDDSYVYATIHLSDKMSYDLQIAGLFYFISVFLPTYVFIFCLCRFVSINGGVINTISINAAGTRIITIYLWFWFFFILPTKTEEYYLWSIIKITPHSLFSFQPSFSFGSSFICRFELIENFYLETIVILASVLFSKNFSIS